MRTAKTVPPPDRTARRRRLRAAVAVLVAALTTAATFMLVTANAQAAISTGTWYTVTSRLSGLVLDVEGASTATGAQLVQQTATGAASQQFRFIDAGNGYYRIQVRHSNLVLDVYEWNASNGATIAQWTDLGGTNQQWRATETDGHYIFTNRFSGKNLDLWEHSTAPGTRISQYDPTGAANQQWRLDPAGTTPTDPPTTGEPAQEDCDSPPSAPGSLTGNLGAHDPAVWVGCAGEPWYVFATGDARNGGGTPAIRRSTDGGRTWQSLGTIWNSKPAWITQQISGVSNLWAPEVFYDADQGLYYLYYAASTFGSQRSAIGLATSPTLDPSAPGYGWTDRGAVLQSYAGNAYNAIDPNIIEDESGRHWMAFGSWWEGIHIVELDWSTGKPAAGATPIRLATKGGGIEAPSMTYRNGYYYLFTSIGTCCAGADSTYKITVGRSTSPSGPFVDANGVDMRNGGGTVVLGAYGNNVASGGQSIHRGFIAYHAYGSNGGFTLDIEQIEWNSAGWPLLNGS
ncbi:RICIN domain-containing protein [Glycomyces paridis]|nr:RICIN domain-containing protein [Glycomyces paridis]